jgi:hypothetical protein
MLKLPENHRKRFIKCNGCGYESPFIVKDLWEETEDGYHYCNKCQKKENRGYFKAPEEENLPEEKPKSE